MKIFFKIILLYLCVFSVTFAQRSLKITVDNNGKEEVLSYVTRMGNTFVSAKELSKILSANYYLNNEALKAEIKFAEYNLKFTAKNQFLIITRKSDGTRSIIQTPVSSIYFNNDVFIPLIYSLDYINTAHGKKISFDVNSKTLSVTNEVANKGIPVFENEIKTPPVKENTEIAAVGKPNSKYDIYDIAIEEKSNGTLIKLKTSKKINLPKYSIGNNTLFLFFSNISISPDLFKNVKPIGLVKAVKRSNPSAKNTQLEFALVEKYSSSEVYQDIESNDLVVTIHNKMFTAETIPIEEVKTKWVFDTVVIDAGHGGKDPGAIGMTGVREKDVNLGIALKLGSIIEKNIPSVKVVYTRKSDEFVELYKRGKIANEAGGKLFISIHCNSTVKKDIAHRGFEVYLLRPGRTKEAIDIAEFENSVIKLEENPQRYQKLTDENFILVSMAHSQYMRYSEKFSDILNQDWKRNVEIPTLGIKQAGFYVLVGASMPSVLIETGFLSNRKDEAHLKSSRGQSEIAEAIFKSIKKYKDYYDKEINYTSGAELKGN